ncbi:MAG: NAAT family transporter [Candidatus Competibacteraceae bacterium]|nr:NAAT family transporter [Candidatus Competibacteraceae bacterium]
MNELLSFGILCFTTFITIINPLSTLPVFLTMTNSLDDAQRKQVAVKAVITAFIALVLFAFTGQFIFDFFNITANGFRVAGGILFFMMGYDMLNARITRIKISKAEVKEYTTDISITPLGIPMICGPGAITNAILMMGESKTVSQKGVLIATMLIVCLIMLVTLYGGARLIKLMGQTTMKVLMRIMGLILMVIAVEFFFAGLKPIVQDILQIQ